MREWKVKLAYSTVQRDSLSKEDAVPQNLAAIAEGIRALVEQGDEAPSPAVRFDDEWRAVALQKPIDAMKMLRNACTGMTLKEAKMRVDAWRQDVAQFGVPAPRPALTEEDLSTLRNATNALQALGEMGRADAMRLQDIRRRLTEGQK